MEAIFDGKALFFVNASMDFSRRIETIVYIFGLHSGSHVFHGSSSCARFRTDPDLPGVERLAVIQPDSSFLESRYVPLPKLPDAGLGPSGFCSKQ